MLNFLLQTLNAVKPEIVSDGGAYSSVSIRAATTREAVVAQCGRVRDAVRSLLALYTRSKSIDFRLTDEHYLMPDLPESEYNKNFS